ncbi:MAG: cyclodeaminase/cyclohydrolase family protein, partial [Thermoplasmatales archaeon]
ICEKILDVAMTVAEKGNQNSITDAAVSAIMAQAGVKSAILNVKINLGSIKDEKFVKNISNELEDIKKKTIEKSDRIIKTVENKI